MYSFHSYTLNFKSLALSALVAASTINGIAAPEAQAYGGGGQGCYAPSAARAINDALSGGATRAQAWYWAIDDGYAVDTQRCWTVVVGYARQLRYVFPYASQL